MANYTINEIPDTATEVGNADLAVVWQNNATKKISILNLLKTLVKKSEVTNTVSASSDKVITSKGVSSLLTIPVGNTTITNAPPLQNNATYRFFFTEQITGSDDTTAMSISYNGTSYSVKATSNGSLKDFTAYPIATEQTRELKKGEKSEEEKEETKGETKSKTRATVTTYVYCQAYTTLEMMFDGTQFIIMGNPVVISNSDYTVYTDGSITYKASRTIINAYMEIKHYPATFTQREVFYGLRDELALADENGALAYVLGNVDGQPFNNIYQLNGVRYFRNGETDVLHVQWNQDVATGKVITILFTRI